MTPCWYVKDFADGWMKFYDVQMAIIEAKQTGALMLYSANGSYPVREANTNKDSHVLAGLREVDRLLKELGSINENSWAHEKIIDAVETMELMGIDEWLPLESCPSDGSPVWVYRPDMPDKKITEELADGEYWRARIKYDYTKYPATHWMPRKVPAPPIIKGNI